MKLPNPSGFNRTSPSARICEHIEDADKGKSRHMPLPLDLRSLFDLPSARRPRLPARLAVSLATTFSPLWNATTERATIFLPLIINGQPVVRRNKAGELKAVKFPVEITTCAVTVTLEHGRFTLAASSRGNNVHDSRDDSRKPMALVRADLRRLFADDADRIAAALADVMPGQRTKKPRPVKPLNATERGRVEKLIAARDKEEKQIGTKHREASNRALSERAGTLPCECEPDFAVMSAEEFAAYNAAALAESAAAMVWLHIDTALAGDRPEIATPRPFPAPFCE